LRGLEKANSGQLRKKKGGERELRNSCGEKGEKEHRRCQKVVVI